MSDLLARLGVAAPVFQAPMAGVSTPAMAAAVSEAGGLGAIGVGAVDAETARTMIAAVQALTGKAFNVNVFCHRPAVADPAREAAWLRRLAPEFARYDAEPPRSLREIYRSFLVDDAMLEVLVETRPAVVSLHFGLPSAPRLARLREAGILVFAGATSLAEARACEAAGVDAIVAQGWEAGGHRGAFDPEAPDDRLGTFALTRLLADSLNTPVIAAGGVMDGAGIAAALQLGATAAQLGTAFVACPESSADAAYRAALTGPAAQHTVMTRAISGRSARCLSNRFTAWSEGATEAETPAYPIAYDAGKALNAAAKAKGEGGWGAQWAGQGAPLARAAPAGELVRTLIAETEEASVRRPDPPRRTPRSPG